jgi:pyruvate formate lyase activating enzyme
MSRPVKVAGFIRNSFIDWPSNISFVVFLGGCNFACPHCHNRKILSATSNTIPFDTVLAEIRAQLGFVDGVVISGGEPTQHPHLRQIIAQIRALGLPIKLDTNGADFETLHALVTEGLVDFVAMDIKAPLEKYTTLGFTADESAVENVKQSIALIKKMGSTRAMFRTTPIPELTTADLNDIVKLTGGITWVKNNFVRA